MKGLLYRELYLQRKGIITILIVVLVCFGLGVLSYLSLLYGNLGKVYVADSGMSAEEVADTLFYLCSYGSAAIVMLMPAAAFELVAADFQVGWMRFQTSLPYKPIHYAAVKILMIGGQLLFGMGISVVLCLMSCAIFDRETPLGEMLVPVLLITMVCGTISVLMLLVALLFRSKTGIASGLFLVGMMMLVLIIIASMPQEVMLRIVEYFRTEIKGNVTAFLRRLLPWCVGVMSIVILGGLLAMTALFKRRER